MGTSPSKGRAADAALWAACAAAAAVPWAWAPGLRDAWALPKCLAAAACAWAGLAAWAAAGAPSLALGLEAPVAAGLAAVALASVAALDPLGAWWGPDLEPAAGAFGAAAAAAGLYLGAAAGRLRPDAASAFARATAVSAGAMGAWAAVSGGSGLYLGRAAGTFGHPVAFGAYLAFAAPGALAWLLSARGRGVRAAASACLAGVVLGLAAAGGRSSWLAAAAGGALVLWSDGRAWSRRAALGALAAGLAGALVLSVRLGAAGQREGARLGGWSIAWNAFLERPVQGWGPGSFSLLYRRGRDAKLASAESAAVVLPHAHNDWLEVLSATGLLGGAAYLWLHAAGVAAALRAPGAAAGLGGAAALLVQSKLNMPPAAVTFLGAAGLGAALAAAPAPAAGRVPAAALFALACLAAAVLPLSRLSAERANHLGRLARARGLPAEAARHFESAVVDAPGVVRFRLDLMNLLFDVAAASGPAERPALLERARDVALGGARLRPFEPELARLLGFAELRRAEAGAPSLPAARAALEAARAADPFNPLTLQDLGAVAGLEAAGRRSR